jgi:hypothetical protein
LRIDSAAHLDAVSVVGQAVEDAVGDGLSIFNSSADYVPAAVEINISAFRPECSRYLFSSKNIAGFFKDEKEEKAKRVRVRIAVLDQLPFACLGQIRGGEG